ncbi:MULTISPECIES: PPC domain-containing DNA-binding protein [Methanobacterium]|uniref:DNA-binding protein n=1 Tax=Methanobacterium bryantii TaxID=2161 RepID=A0A2A2H7B0_METBR|nr:MULTISPECIES: PPC domain-containing DNA-binding protein [Methanobacterium]OEC84982.1 DNA-binding protein [Methanobacterium sp. A39]PAV05133.1 DNA-binding protein [Methanobacterium bryantii]
MIISRLKPQEDLKKGIINISKQNGIKSGIIICMVGSLNSATLRMADGNYKTFTGPFEIVSAEGTISADGIHVHISISDAEGHVFGGHLSDGCIINTTAEIGILKSDKTLIRVFDPETGYKELIIDD